MANHPCQKQRGVLKASKAFELTLLHCWTPLIAVSRNASSANSDVLLDRSPDVSYLNVALPID